MAMKRDPLGLWCPLEAAPVRLDPLDEVHHEGLRAACAADAAIWKVYARSYDAAHFDAAFAELLANPARFGFAVMVNDEIAGMTAWIDADPVHRRAEIGNTYLAPAWRGAGVNTTMKRLLFGHGFACGLKRMQLTVDVRNARSQAACRKVGASFEGIARNHMVTWTGYERDSAVFSVVTRDRERLKL